MNKVHADTIERLAEELQPVRPMKARDGYLLAGAAGAVTLMAVVLVAGMWDGVVTGEASPFFAVVNGLLLVVGLAGIAASVALAGPHVGNRQDSANWALAMLGVLPLAALASAIGAPAGLSDTLVDPHALTCFLSGSVASALTFVALAFWLKRGAPVSTVSAGTVAGAAAGAVGSFAYGWSCPIDGVAHLGIWHVLPVALCAAIGRIVMPRFLRW